MKTVKDILTPEEFCEYQEAWNEFNNRRYSNKYPPTISEYEAHSGMPVLARVFQFGDKPVFRAHVLNNRLKKFDPYHLSKEYPIPFWNMAHYLMTLEQMYHASIRHIRDMTRILVREIPLEIRLSKPTFWRDNISIEFMWQPRRKAESYAIEDCYFAFHEDKRGEIKGQITIRTFVQPRAYRLCAERLKQIDNTAREELIRKIELQNIYLGRLLKPRQHLQTSADELIAKLQAGEIPEDELDDFFSFWDKPEF